MSTPTREQLREPLQRLGNPYAVLSILSEEELDGRSDVRQWQKPKEFVEFVSAKLCVAQIDRRFMPRLKSLAARAAKLTSKSQSSVASRISGLSPGNAVAHNRISASEMERILSRLESCVSDAEIVDASED